MKTWAEHRKEMAMEERREWAVTLLYSAIIFTAVFIAVI
jgi:hypothetical protein